MSKQSRAYNGIEYALCKSMDELIKNIGQAIERNDMAFELLRREAEKEAAGWEKEDAR